MKGNVHLPLFLFAFAIALVVKIAVYESERPSERVIEAQVTYNAPSGEVVLYDLIEAVRVGVQGQANEVAQLSPFTVEVVVDVEQDRTGPTDVALEPGNVRFRAPGDFDVVSIEPNRFTIQMERRAQETVQVRAVLTGEPAAGAQSGEVVVRPAWVEISGPESQVRRVGEVVAQVSLDGHARTFEDAVPVVSPDPLIKVQPGRVIVEVTMHEPELDLSAEDLQSSLSLPDGGVEQESSPS